MKLRPALVAFALLLLTGSLASASSTASPANEEVAPMTSADGTSGCPTDELAFLNPAPTEKATGICGSCSGVCAGGQIGQICGRNSACEVPYAERCSDGQVKCYCLGGPGGGGVLP